MVSLKSTLFIKITEVKSKKLIKLMPGPVEMSHKEPSCHSVRKPSRHIKKPLLDVPPTASAEVPVNSLHELPDVSEHTSGAFISNMKLP